MDASADFLFSDGENEENEPPHQAGDTIMDSSDEACNESDPLVTELMGGFGDAIPTSSIPVQGTTTIFVREGLCEPC